MLVQIKGHFAPMHVYSCAPHEKLNILLVKQKLCMLALTYLVTVCVCLLRANISRIRFDQHRTWHHEVPSVLEECLFTVPLDLIFLMAKNIELNRIDAFAGH